MLFAHSLSNAMRTTKSTISYYQCANRLGNYNWPQGTPRVGAFQVCLWEDHAGLLGETGCFTDVMCLALLGRWRGRQLGVLP